MATLKKTDTKSGVGIVIPVHNRPTVLVDTIEYVLRQTRQPEKLVIVDDGSTDDTAGTAERFLCAQNPVFDYVVLRTPKTTASESRAKAFEEVSHLPYLSFLDSDDHWPCDFLERCLQVLQEDGDAVAAIADREHLNTIGEKPEHIGGSAFTADPIPWIFEYGAGIASCTLMRTDAYLRAGGWPSYRETSDDVEIFTMISLLGKWAYAAGESVKYHIGNSKLLGEQHNLSRTRVNTEIKWARDYDEIYREICLRTCEKDWHSLRPLLARRWYLAGKQALKQNDRKSARRCYMKALAMHPYSWKVWRRLARCMIAK